MKRVLSILVAAVFLLAAYAPVSAGDWDLYGSARVTTFWTDYDEDYGGVLADSTQLNHSLQGNARFGAIVRLGDIGGRLEYGASGGNANIRLLYATIPLGPGQLLVGQDYSPFGMGSFISTQVYDGDNGMLQFLGYTGRNAMVQYSTGGFSFALVQPGAPSSLSWIDPATVGDPVPTIVTAQDGSPEVLLPNVQARYSFEAMPGLRLDVAGLIQTYELRDLDDERLTSWGLTANVGLNMMNPFYARLGGFFGQNMRQAGQYSFKAPNASPFIDAAENNIEDTDTWGVLFVVGTQMGGIGLQAGVGYTISENDEWENDDEMTGYYLQAVVPMGVAGARIIPEIGYYDYDNGVNTNEFYVGLQWRIDF